MAQISFAVTAKLICTAPLFSLHFLNPKFLATVICDCTAWFVSDLAGTQIVGFLMHRLICIENKGHEFNLRFPMSISDDRISSQYDPSC